MIVAIIQSEKDECFINQGDFTVKEGETMEDAVERYVGYLINRGIVAECCKIIFP